MGEREQLKVTSGFGDSGCAGTNRGGGAGGRKGGVQSDCKVPGGHPDI